MASGRTYPDLRILSIMNEHVGDQTFQYIKRAIPNLEVLYWMMGYNHTDMDLTRWDFYKCELLISSKKETENCSVTIQGATKELYIGLKRKLCYQILYLTFYLVKEDLHSLVIISNISRSVVLKLKSMKMK